MIIATILAGLAGVASLQQLDSWALRLRAEPIANALKVSAELTRSMESNLEFQRTLVSIQASEQNVAKLSEMQKRFAALTQRQEKLEDAQLSMLTAHGLSDVIPSLLARVAILGATLFLTQILLGIYRYNSRLATYYEGRANALQIAREFGEDLPIEDAVGLFAGDSVAFGKQPSTPMEQTIDVLKTALDGARDIAKVVK